MFAVASMGPRSFNRGNADCRRERGTIPARLQWGRGLSTAEITLCVRSGREVSLLQWGRGLSTAEIRLLPTVRCLPARLQWGRGLSTAEMIPTPWAEWTPTCCFNGAAVFQPRKSVDDSMGRAAGYHWLQWGRGLSTAEISTRPKRPAIARPASMGPRSFNRGNMHHAGQCPGVVIASMGPRSFNRGNDHR